MSTMDEAMNYMADLAASTKFDVDMITPTWNSGTAGSAYAIRWGRVVTIMISNPTKLARGNNNIFTLPVGWRPLGFQYLEILAHPGASDATSCDLRFAISTSGVASIYNYKTSAVSGNTNASLSLTYICDRELGGV